MQNDKYKLREKIKSGERIKHEEAVSLFSWDLPELGMLADFRRDLVYPENTVGFIVNRIINFTNRCKASCRFCAYHSADEYELTMEQILEKAGELEAIGGSQIMLQGGLHPDYTIDDYTAILREIKKHYPDLYLHSFSPAETVHMACKSGMSISEVIGELKASGLDSMPGASDMLVDRIRQAVSPRKCTVKEWREVMHALRSHNLGSSATMTYGMGETLDEKIEHLEVVRQVQDDTGIIRAFIPWSFSPWGTAMEDIPSATGVDYLKMIAISRIYLDNITHIQAGWLTEGMKLAQIALAMGATDMGGTLTEEVVVRAAGITTRTNMEELIYVIKNSGKIPMERDSEYRQVRIHDNHMNGN